MTPTDLDLPTLGPLLDAVSEELDTGRGFAVLRGMDLPPGDVDYAYRVNWILALSLGDVIAQNANGRVEALQPPAMRAGYFTRARYAIGHGTSERISTSQ